MGKLGRIALIVFVAIIGMKMNVNNIRNTMKNYTVFILFLYLISCNQNMGYKDIQTLDFRQEKCANPFEILEMDFIKLETTDVCLIDKNIRQIESTTEKLFILTGGESKLMAFDMSGKFLEQIGRIGAGPGEYILATSFSIDQHRNLISVMDAAQSKIVSYNLSNYEFVSQKPTPGRICFEYYGKDRIVWQNVDVNNELKNHC